MPTSRQQIEAYVDEGIRNGSLNAQYRSKYIDDMAADPKAAEYFAGGFMRTADYTKKSQEREEQWRQRQGEIESQRQAVARERQELQNWQVQAKAEIDRLRAYEGETPKLQAAVARYQQILKDYNLTESDPLNGQPAPSPTAPTYQPPTTPTYQPPQSPVHQPWVSRDDAVSALNGILDVTGEYAAIQAEHQFLYGSPLRDNLINEARQAGQLNNLRGFWEGKYNVPGKRADIDAKTREDEITRIRQEEREKVMAELASDPSRVIGAGGTMWQPERGPLDSYMNASRAMHNPVAPEARTGDTPAGQTAPRIPEQVNHVQSVRDSVSGAVKFFNSRFNPDGTPISRGPDRAS
jgi:hypothetical protein